MSADESSSLIDDPSLATLGQLFNPNTWENGEDYADRNRVTSLTLKPDPNAQSGWVMDAVVRGRMAYNVWLDLGCDESGQWYFSGGCNCPVGQRDERCKHLAAVLNVLAEKHPEVVPFFPPKKHSKPLVPAWAAILQPTAEPSPPPPPPPSPPPRPVRAPVAPPPPVALPPSPLDL